MTDYFKPREDSATETAPAQAEGPQPRFSMEGINVEEPAAQAAPVADDAAALIADWFDAAAADWSATGTETSAQVSAVSEADRAALDASRSCRAGRLRVPAVRDGASAPAMLLFSQAAAISTAQAMLGPDVKEVDDCRAGNPRPDRSAYHGQSPRRLGRPGRRGRRPLKAARRVGWTPSRTVSRPVGASLA